MILRPDIFGKHPILAAQSTRQGGISPAPFDSMNLGLSTNDQKKNVLKNRDIFFDKLGIKPQQIVRSKQVHGNKILVTDSPCISEGYDAFVTDKPGVFLVISIADCTPVLIYDTKNKVVAAIHAGWKGTAGNIVLKALQQMQQDYKTKGSDCIAYVGACISFDSFEVGEEVAEKFSVSEKRFDTGKQKYFVDLKGANFRQLTDFGLKPDNIEVSPYCTYQDNTLFFSYRKGKGQTGRMMAVIGLKG
jgi:polyphenol oxidase